MRNVNENQFGLNGQYNNFLGAGKSGKRKRALRMEKRKLKNEERRVNTDRARAEAQLIQQMTEPAAPVAEATPAATTPPETEEESFVSEPTSKVGQTGKSKKSLIKIAAIAAAALVLIGVGIYAIRQRKTSTTVA